MGRQLACSNRPVHSARSHSSNRASTQSAVSTSVTQNSEGCKFSIIQSNPAAAGATGTIEAFPVVGSVPEGAVDYPMLEAAGCEVLRGGLEDPVHVLEGSINFNIIHKYPAGTPLTGDRIGIAYWGFEKIPE